MRKFTQFRLYSDKNKWSHLMFCRSLETHKLGKKKPRILLLLLNKNAKEDLYTIYIKLFFNLLKVPSLNQKCHSNHPVLQVGFSFAYWEVAWYGHIAVVF
jgi:hypothetical protein